MVSLNESDKPERTGHGRSLIRFITVVLIGLALVAYTVVFLRGQNWSTAEDRDNYQELNIVGRSMEGWPNSIGALARANLLPDRLEAPPSALLKREGWSAAARLDHPDIGMLHVLYKLDNDVAENRQVGVNANGNANFEVNGNGNDDGNDKGCDSSTRRAVSVDPVKSSLEISGSLKLFELWQGDQELAMASSDVKEPKDGNFSQLINAINPKE